MHEHRKKSTALDLKEMMKLLGPAPVLSSESLKDYNAMLKRLMDCIDPGDFMEQYYVKELVDQIWEINRLRLHKVMVMEREHQRHQEKEMKRWQEEKKKKAEAAEWDAERAKAAEQAGKTEQTERAEQASAPTTLFDRKLALEEVIDSTEDEVDDIFGPADEVDHARALQSGIEYYEKLDDLLGVAIARRDDVLAQLDFYRQGLGQRLRRVSDEIVDAEFKETKHQRSPALTVMSNDVCQKGGGQPDERPQEPGAAHRRRQGAREPQRAPARACCLQQQG